jgi:hypothetical protein
MRRSVRIEPRLEEDHRVAARLGPGGGFDLPGQPRATPTTILRPLRPMHSITRLPLLTPPMHFIPEYVPGYCGCVFGGSDREPSVLMTLLAPVQLNPL